jgi:hypothetical protein
MKSNRTATAAALALLLVILAVSTILPAAAAPQPAPLMSNPGATGLVSCWPMNETSGTRADLYGGNNLTDNNTVGNATGKVGNAADFELDNSEYLSGSNISLTSFTIGGWFYVESINIGFQNLFVKWDPTNNNRIFQLSISNNKFYIATSSNGTSTIQTFAEDTISANTWYYVVATFSQNGKQSIRVNNASVVENDITTLHDANVGIVLGVS